MFGTYLSGAMVLEVIAVVHFFRSRNQNWYWLWIILGLGPLGSIIYIALEVVPDLQAGWAPVRLFERKKRIRQLELIVQENPAAGNYEELADLYFQQKDYRRARECYDRAISSRTDMPHPFYGRALSAMYLGDWQAAARDLEKTLSFDRTHDFHRALGLLAYCLERSGEKERAEKLYREALTSSLLSETQYNFAHFLAEQGRKDEARKVVQAILNKQPTLPKYLRRKERPWFGKANSLLKQLA